MKKIIIILFLILIISNVKISAFTISYQGKLLDSSQRRVNAAASIIFSLYTSETGGTAIWTETHNSVNISNGLFTVELGSVNQINLKFDNLYYIGININNSGELIPRTKFQATPYSFRSRYSDTSVNLENNATAEGSMTINDTLIISNNVIITDNGKIGVGLLNPSEKIEVIGNVKATAFIGDGSQLTNVQYSSLTGDAISGSEVRNLLNTIRNDSIATSISFTKIEGDTITKTEVNNKLLLISSDTSILNNRLASLENDSVTKTYVDSNLLSFKSQVYTETQNIYSRLDSLTSDTQNIKTDLSSFKSQVYTETQNIYSRLDSLTSDTQNIKTDLSNFKSQVYTETQNIYSRLN
ncbi:hypothetical protein KA977_09295, partial [Candidatus Dependentiae bacterium]|nr:hypothetical protein [Candidatus Dependentiae bacterium]